MWVKIRAREAERAEWHALRRIPFGEKPVSMKAQTEGVIEAAEWFLRDARMTGTDGQLIQDAVARLGTLFRRIRYADKPAESSVSTFSYEPASVTAETRRLLELAEQLLLLVYVGGQRHKNTKRIDMKFQVNRLLAPRWDMSSTRRGTLDISGEELNAIFDPVFTVGFEEMLNVRIDRMTAPFFGKKSGRTQKTDTGQRFLFNDDA